MPLSEYDHVLLEELKTVRFLFLFCCYNTQLSDCSLVL
jgi:hypothetical protein